jgi:hypothetical protein
MAFRRNEASFLSKSAEQGFAIGLMSGPRQDPRMRRRCLSRRPLRRSWRLCSPEPRPKPAAAERPREPCPWRHRVWRLPAFRQPPRQRFCACPRHWPLAFSHIPGDSFGPRERVWHINAEAQCGLRPQERARPERGVLETPLSEPRQASHPLLPSHPGRGTRLNRPSQLSQFRTRTMRRRSPVPYLPEKGRNGGWRPIWALSP